MGWTGAGPSEFVEQLNRARRARASWGWAALLTCVAASLVAAQASPEIRTDSPNYLLLALAAIVALLGAVATYLLYGWDCTRRQVAVFYDVEDEAAARFQWVVESCEATATAAAWELVASSDRLYGHTQKVNAGASNLVKRERLMRHMSGPKHLRTNVPLPSFTTARTALYLLPDRALAHTPSGYVEIGYRNLACSYNAARFIETNPVPPDAPVVDSTWQAVNKDGSPDRRFNNNRQIPVVLYGELALWHVATTQSVPITTWQLSNPARAEQLGQVFEHLRTT